MASGSKPVPLDHCPLIQSFTEGEVTCEELRPDKVEYFALIRAQAKSDQAQHPMRRASDKPHPLRRSTDHPHPMRRSTDVPPRGDGHRGEPTG